MQRQSDKWGLDLNHLYGSCMFETLNYFIAFISSTCVSLWAKLESFVDLSSARFNELICFVAPTSVCLLSTIP